MIGKRAIWPGEPSKRYPLPLAHYSFYYAYISDNVRGDRNSVPPLSFKGQAITPAQQVQLLGVVMDSKLSFRSHVAEAAARAQEAALAVKRLKGL